MSERPDIEGVVPLDVEHLGLQGAICAYLLERPEPTLVDPGPATSLATLEAALDRRGLALTDLRHLLVTHVHLDHAGAAGHLAEAVPRLTVHAHEDAAPHLADPARLVASTRRTFGEAHDRLWGEVRPVPRARLRAWRPGDPAPLAGIRPMPTPGHIAHHLAWHAERDGVLFCGDSLGIVLDPEGPSHPATPPPAVDLAGWLRTLRERLGEVESDVFAPTHFGLQRGLAERRARLEEALLQLARRVAAAMAGGPEAEAADRDAFHDETLRAHAPPLSPERAERYFSTFSARTDWDGMRFHLERTPGAARLDANPS